MLNLVGSVVILLVGIGAVGLGLLLRFNQRVFEYNVRHRKPIYSSYADPEKKTRREQRMAAWVVVGAGLAIIALGVSTAIS